MYIGQDFFPANSTEDLPLAINFVNDLPSGDTISSATITCTVADDSGETDATPQARIVGGPFYPNSTTVSFSFGGSPVTGCKYKITITATTAAGAVITDYTHILCEVPL